jgi:hypothetical protein
LRVFELPSGAHIDLDSVQLVFPVHETFFRHGSVIFPIYRFEVSLALRSDPVQFDFEYDCDYTSMTTAARLAAKNEALEKANAERDALLAACKDGSGA